MIRSLRRKRQQKNIVDEWQYPLNESGQSLPEQVSVLYPKPNGANEVSEYAYAKKHTATTNCGLESHPKTPNLDESDHVNEVWRERGHELQLPCDHRLVASLGVFPLGCNGCCSPRLSVIILLGAFKASKPARLLGTRDLGFAKVVIKRHSGCIVACGVSKVLLGRLVVIIIFIR